MVAPGLPGLRAIVTGDCASKLSDAKTRNPHKIKIQDRMRCFIFDLHFNHPFAQIPPPATAKRVAGGGIRLLRRLWLLDKFERLSAGTVAVKDFELHTIAAPGCRHIPAPAASSG